MSRRPRRRIQSITGRAEISVHDLCYSVNVKTKGKFCATEEKTILQNVSQIFQPGMNAIMGSSGSGKTSLLDVLAGRKDPTGITGDVLFNGSPQPKHFKYMTGYVVQDDIVMGTLTVRENIMFSANMRLSKMLTEEEKQERVEGVIHDLGLERCADTKVGNEFIRGVSGGERKRTCIGMELIVSPSLLFLDEPTTGLDSTTANAVLNVLSRISKRGRTIIFSIHQPRYSIFRLFDRLSLMAKGRTVYHGPMNQALDYFAGLGYVCDELNNPADFFLDIITGDQSVMRVNDDSTDTDVATLAISENTSNVIQIKTDDLADFYDQSACFNELQQELEPIRNAVIPEADDGSVIELSAPFLTQLKYLSKRSLLNIARHPAAALIQIAVVCFFGFVVGLVFFDQGRKLPEALQNRNGFLFLGLSTVISANRQAIEMFMNKEKIMFQHERSNGMYRTSTYFVTKILFDIIPIRLLPIIFHCLISYPMFAGSDTEADKLFFYIFIHMMASLSSASINLMVGASLETFSVAFIISTALIAFYYIFGGLMVNLVTIWVGVRWLQYFNIMKYSYNALLINEYKDFKFLELNQTNNYVETYAGREYLDSLDVAYETDWDLWQNVFALAVITIVFFILAYVQLRRIKTYR